VVEEQPACVVVEEQPALFELEPVKNNTCFFFCLGTNRIFGFCLFAASPLMGAQSFPNLTTTGTTSTVTMSTSIVTSSNNVATATTGLSVGQLLSNTLTTSLTSTSSESDTGQEAEFSLYGRLY
jgi:hypothetical protein